MGEKIKRITKKAVRTTVITILIVVAILLLLLLFHTCKKHEHVYDDGVITVQPSCTDGTAGEKKYTCTVCGQYYTEPVTASGHDYAETVHSATCTAEGYTEKVCKRCGESEIVDKVPATGHTYRDEVVAPTCAAEGYTSHTCTVCGYTYTDSATEKTAHSYQLVGTTAPTDTTCGYNVYTCSVCNHGYSEEIPAKGHSFDGGVVTQQATCYQAGVKRYTCNTCGVYYDKSIAMTSHSWKEEASTAATCSAAGSVTYTCTVCGGSYSTSIPALGHTWGEWQTVTAASCGVAGSEQRVCSRDGSHVDAREIAATGNHTYGDWTTVAATCTKDGSRTRTCSVCAQEDKETLSATGHTAVKDGAVAATCTTTGKTEGSHCSVCGSTLIAQTTVSALGHNYKWSVTKDPTVSSSGTAEGVCQRNSAHVQQLTLPALTSEHVKEGEYTLDHTTVATCKTNGIDTYTYVYDGQSFVFKVDLGLGSHNYVYQASLSDYTSCEGGIKKSKCSVCDGVTSETVTHVGHKYVNGICSVCGEKKPANNFYVSSATVWPEDSFTVALKATDAKFAEIGITVTYDSARLTLETVEFDSDFSGKGSANTATEGSIVFSAARSSGNWGANCTVAYMTFKVKKDIENTTTALSVSMQSIKFAYKDLQIVGAADGEDISCSLAEGTVTILKKTTATAGAYSLSYTSSPRLKIVACKEALPLSVKLMRQLPLRN